MEVNGSLAGPASHFALSRAFALSDFVIAGVDCIYVFMLEAIGRQPLGDITPTCYCVYVFMSEEIGRQPLGDITPTVSCVYMYSCQRK